MDLITYYTQRITNLKIDIEKLKKSLQFLSLYRLVAFLFSFLQFFIFYKINVVLSFVVFGISFALFVYFIRKYNVISFQKEVINEKLQLNKNELKAQHWDYSGFDSGIELDNPQHPFVNDLDIFLNQGFFQSINRSSSNRAKEILANFIINPPHKIEFLENRQATVNELSNKNEWGQDFLAFCKTGLEGTEKDNLNNWLKSPSEFLHKRNLNFSRFVIPVITILFLGLSIIKLIPSSIVSYK